MSRPIWLVVTDNDDGEGCIEGAYTSEARAAGEAATLAESLCDSYGLPRSAIDADEDGLTIDLGERAQVRVVHVNLYGEEQS